ncbi:MAG: ATP synthase F1 subunit epsilon [Rickettsiaceae bacterium]
MDVNTKLLSVKIICPSNTILDMKADMVNVPGVEGMFGVLPGHAKLIASVKVGLVSVFCQTQETKYFVYGGVAQVLGDELNIVSEFAAEIKNVSSKAIKTDLNELKKRLANIDKQSLESEIIVDKIEKYKSLLSFL